MLALVECKSKCQSLGISDKFSVENVSIHGDVNVRSHWKKCNYNCIFLLYSAFYSRFRRMKIIFFKCTLSNQIDIDIYYVQVFEQFGFFSRWSDFIWSLNMFCEICLVVLLKTFFTTPSVIHLKTTLVVGISRWSICFSLFIFVQIMGNSLSASLLLVLSFPSLVHSWK